MNTKKASLYDKEKLTSGYDFDPFFTFRCVFCLVCVAQTPRVAGISEYIKKAKIKDAINSTNTSHTTTNHLINDTWEYSSSSALGDLWLAVLFFFLFVFLAYSMSFSLVYGIYIVWIIRTHRPIKYIPLILFYLFLFQTKSFDSAKMLPL